MKDDSDGDKKQQIHHIQNLFAFNLFCQKRFDDSMQVFAKLGTGRAFIAHSGHLFSVCSGQICKTATLGSNCTRCDIHFFLSGTHGYFSPHHSFQDYHLPDLYIKHVNDAYFSKQPVVLMIENLFCSR